MSEVPSSRHLSLTSEGEKLASLMIGNAEFTISIYHPWHAKRRIAEQFIRDQFSKMHGAQIDSYMPSLIALEDKDGLIVAIAGLRSAKSSKLFLEQYIDLPIERIASSALQATVLRTQLVEIGNLASVGKGYSRYLFVALTALLIKWDLIWLSFTGTQQVLNVFSRLGLQPVVVAPASKSRLGDEQSKWGRYYDSTPYVMVGDVRGGHKTLSNLGVYKSLSLSFSSGAHYVLSA